MELLDEVTAAFEDFLFASGQMAVIESEQTRTEQANSEVDTKILDILQEEVRPAIAQDGGDFIYHGFENGMVKFGTHRCLRHMSILNRDAACRH